MGRKPSDGPAIDRTILILRVLGCPNPRRGQGSAEWDRTKGAYVKTPDIVAGGLFGNGDPRDFYVDVFSPTGDQFQKQEAGNPGAVELLRDAAQESLSVGILDLKDDGISVYAQVNKKLAAYSASRSSPMLGTVMYFNAGTDREHGPTIASGTTLRYLVELLEVDKKFGGESARAIATHGLMKQASVQLIFVPLGVPMMFLLWLRDFSAQECPSIILFVNAPLLEPPGPFAGHEVIAWLQRLRSMKERDLLALWRGSWGDLEYVQRY